MNLGPVITDQLPDIPGGLRVGGDEQGGLHGLHIIQRVQICVHIVEKGDGVLAQRGLAGDAVGKEHNVVRRAEAHHVKGVSRKGDDLYLAGKAGVSEGGDAAFLGEEELVAQIPAGAAAVEEGGLQDGVLRKGPLHAVGEDPAAGMVLQKAVSADVVRVGMGIEYAQQGPAVGVQHLPGPFSSVLAVAAVDQIGALGGTEDAQLGGAVDIKGVFTGLNQFVHGVVLLGRSLSICPVYRDGGEMSSDCPQFSRGIGTVHRNIL